MPELVCACTCLVAMSCASLYLPSHTNWRTLGRYSKASGLALLLGRPAQMVSSLSCSRSADGTPKIMAPNRLLPMGSASVHVVAGLSYHSTWAEGCGLMMLFSDDG